MDAVAGPACLAVGYFQKRKHLVDPDAYVCWIENIPLYFARCGAVSIPTMVPGPRMWCAICMPEEPSCPCPRSAPSF